MKNQYFGDKRDLLKYSLLEALVCGLSKVDQLTCIWLLTPPATTNDGNRHFQGYNAAPELGAFLRSSVSAGRRDVRELARYMAQRPLRYFSYGHDAALYFTRQSRATYFGSIPAAALRRSVVFFDPDNGLEPAGIVTPAHLKYAELAQVFRRMDSDSLAVVYQHLPRKRAEIFWPSIATRLSSELSSPVGYVADGDVAFFIVTRTRESALEGRPVLEEFSARWPKALLVRPPH